MYVFLLTVIVGFSSYIVGATDPASVNSLIDRSRDVRGVASSPLLLQRAVLNSLDFSEEVWEDLVASRSIISAKAIRARDSAHAALMLADINAKSVVNPIVECTEELLKMSRELSIHGFIVRSPPEQESFFSFILNFIYNFFFGLRLTKTKAIRIWLSAHQQQRLSTATDILEMTSRELKNSCELVDEALNKFQDNSNYFLNRARSISEDNSSYKGLRNRAPSLDTFFTDSTRSQLRQAQMKWSRVVEQHAFALAGLERALRTIIDGESNDIDETEEIDSPRN